MTRTNVFISYSHKDKQWLERLQAHLKPLERAGLVDRWDDTRIGAGEEWHDEIRQALDATRIAVLLISADFLASDFIATDELPPLLDAAEKDNVRILPVIVKPSLFAETPSLSRFQTVNDPATPLIDMSEGDQERVFLEVAKAVRGAVREGGFSSPDNLPESNPYFTGREDVLHDVRAALEQRGRAMLSGLGGMGKTQIAIEYAHRHRDDYDNALWVTAETETALTSGYAHLAHVLSLPQKDEQDQQVIVEAVKAWLETHDGWLLVFDSANEPALLEPLWPRNAKGHLLITTRAHQAQRLGLAAGIPTTRLPPEEAFDFLKNRTERSTLPASEQEAANALAEEVGYLPLALEQAAAYLVENKASFENYLKAYRKRGLGLLEKAEPIAGGYRESVAKTWLLNFEQVEAASPAAADLLRASAFLAPDNIPLDIFTDGAEHLGPALAKALADGDEDSLALAELLKPLTSYSLIRRDVAESVFNVHGLVQEVVRTSLVPGRGCLAMIFRWRRGSDRTLWETRAMRAVNAAFPDVEFKTWPLCERLLPHARMAVAYIKDDPDDAEATSRLLNQIAEYLYYRAKYDEAKPLYRRALTIREQGLGPDHPHTALSLNNLALLLYSQGNYDEAEPLYRRALTIRKQALGPDHPDTAQSLNNLALLFYSQGHYDEAESLLRHALNIVERVLEPHHPDTILYRENLRKFLRKQDRDDEAAALGED